MMPRFSASLLARCLIETAVAAPVLSPVAALASASTLGSPVLGSEMRSAAKIVGRPLEGLSG